MLWSTYTSFTLSLVSRHPNPFYAMQCTEYYECTIWHNVTLIFPLGLFLFTEQFYWIDKNGGRCIWKNVEQNDSRDYRTIRHSASKELGVYTVWPKMLAGNLFWRIGGFESNPPIFPSTKLFLQYAVIIMYLQCGPPSFKMFAQKLQTLKKNGTKIVQIWSTIMWF